MKNLKKKWQPILAAVLIAATLCAALLPAGKTDKEEAGMAYDAYLIRFDGWTVVTENTAAPPGSAQAESVTKTASEPVELPVYIQPDREGQVILENRLPRLIYQGTYLAVYSRGSCVTVTAGGQTIYTNTKENRGKPLPGWNYIRLGPETAGKEITVIFSGPEPFRTGMVTEILLGTYGELMTYANTRVSYDRWINLAILFMGLLVLLFSLVSFSGRQETWQYFYLGILVAACGISGICKNAAADKTFSAYYAFFLAGILLHSLLPSLYCLYRGNTADLKQKQQYRILAWGNLVLTAAGIIVWVYGPPAVLPAVRITACVIFCGVFGFCLYRILRGRITSGRRNTVMVAIGLAVLIACELAGTFTHAGDMVFRFVRPETFGALIFVLLQTLVGLFSAYEHLERQLSLERELNEGRIKLMINQIKPHFINNVMTVIRSMIQYDPDEAEEMVYKFNKYLVYNIEALSSTELCPFSLELSHIKTYLNIELTHLRPRLRITYDIQADDFEIPPLSVQPFAENAVKHGIAPKGDTGTLAIATRETPDSYVIEINDDGVGFDTSRPYDETGGHGIGLNNAVQRLEIMVNGTVDIQSSPGKGTRVMITIPKLKEEDFDEDDLG